MQSSTDSPDVRQRNILNKLIQFLKKYPDGRDSKRHEQLIKLMEKGYCSGFTTLWLYANWVSTQPETGKERDDATWFNELTKEIVKWDGTSDLSPSKQYEYERFINLVDYFQNISSVLPIAQGDLDKSLVDSKGRQPGVQYVLGGLFTEEEAATALQKMLDNKMFSDKFTLFSSHNHATGLFCDKDGKLKFFDPNNPKGSVEIQNGKDLARAIFTSYRYKSDVPSPLGLRIFGFTPIASPVPKTELVGNLTAITRDNGLIKDNKYCTGMSALHMAVKIGDTESVQYYLDKGVDVNYSVSSEREEEVLRSPVHTAISWNRPEVVDQLLKTGKVVLKAEDFYAALRDHSGVILKRLFSVPNKPTLDYSFMLEYAVTNGLADIVGVLLDNGANALAASNKDGRSYTEIAVELGYVDVLSELLKKLTPEIIGSSNLKFHLDKLLTQAIKKDHPYTVKLLLAAGADPSIRFSENQNTAFHYAIEWQQNDIFLAIVNSRRMDYSAVNRYGKTLINSACEVLIKIQNQIKELETDLTTTGEEERKTQIRLKIKKLKDQLDFYNKAIEHLEIKSANVQDAYYYALKDGDIAQLNYLVSRHDYLLKDEKALIIASKAGSITVIDWLLSHQFNINSVVGGTTALHESLFVNIAVVEHLIKKGADVNKLFKDSITPLYTAAQLGNRDLIRLLVDSGADVNVGAIPDETPLVATVRSGQFEAAEFLLEKLHARVNLDVLVESSPLHLAVENNRLNFVKLFLKHGADIYKKDKSGKSSIQLAADKGWNERTSAIFEHAARHGNDGSTSLHIAIEMNCPHFIKEIMRSNYGITYAKRTDGKTALHLAAESGKKEAVEILLSEKDHFYFNEDEKTPSPVDLAYEKGFDEVALMILSKTSSSLSYAIKRGYDYNRIIAKLIEPQIKEVNFHELQKQALKERNYPLAIELLKAELAQMQTNKKDHQNSILHLAAMRGYTNELLTLIIENDETILNKQNQDGNTALMLALLHRHKSQAEYFLDLESINVTVVNGRKNSALHLASGLEDAASIVKTLLGKGAKADEENVDRQTPLYVACKMGHDRVVDELLDQKNKALVAHIKTGYQKLLDIAANEYIRDRLRIRNYIEYRSGGDTYTGWSLGRTKDDKLKAANDVEGMIKAKRFDENVYQQHRKDLKGGTLCKVFGSIMTIKPGKGSA